jgi:excinuclease UvrABC ATPase subunit
LPPKTKVTLLAPKADNRKGEFREVFEEARKAGFVRVRVDGVVRRLEEVTALDKKKKHTVQIVVDRLTLGDAERPRLSDSIETALRAGGGTLLVAVEGEERERAYSESRACPDCGVGLPELSPQSFSFNSPLGMCVDCNGLGSKLEVDPDWSCRTAICPSPKAPSSRGASALDVKKGGPRVLPRRSNARWGFHSKSPGNSSLRASARSSCLARASAACR